MASIEKMIAAMKSVNIRSTVEESLYNTREQLAASQVEQMHFGLKGDGKKIGKYRNKKYAAMKFYKNPLAGLGNVDLRLHGDFQDNIFVDVRSNKVVFASYDEKTEALVKKYGKDIFGLSVPFAKEYSEQFLKPEGIKEIKKRLNAFV